MAAPTPHVQARLEPQALEARTQAIGRELFEAAKRHHTHLSVLNRWTSQVLSWCLGDPAVKSAVLRFIDVLPSLHTSREIVEHIQEYFPTDNLHLPPALRLGASLTRPGILTRGALAGIIRQAVEQVARQFIATPGPEGVAGTVKTLAARGASCSLDVLGEQVVSEAEAQAYMTQCCSLLQDLGRAYQAVRVPSCGPPVNFSLKPSALSPRFDPLNPERSIEEVTQHLSVLLNLATEHHALINLDMEQYELRDLTLALARRLLEDTARRGGPALGVVIQAYLRDAEPTVEGLLAWLAAHERTMTVRLVKGAYWDAEVAQAERNYWPCPVYTDKGETDLAFERLSVRLLSAHPSVTTAIASHNVRSIAHAMATAELLGLAKDHLEFQLLYGMGDALHEAIIERGYPVRVYTPVGERIPGMAYLVRRILENTANESFLRQELFQQETAQTLLQPPQASNGGMAMKGPEGWQPEPLGDFFNEATRVRVARAIQHAKAVAGKQYPLWLGSGPVQSASTLTVRNPAHPDDILGVVAQATPAHVDQAVALAAAAQPAWGQKLLAERVAILRRGAQLLRQRRADVTAWAILETGKPWREADPDVVEAIEYLEYYSAQMERLSQRRELWEPRGERNQLGYVPRGVAVVISPWNFPAAILTGMTSAALVSGNAVIVKPSGQSSIVAAQIVQLLHQAGVPLGALQLLPGSGGEVGAALVRHPGTHLIAFTGSKTVGLSILEAAGRVASGQRFVKHVVTEMGGKNAIIIDADADLDAAVTGSLQSAFGYAGQKCSAASRLIVHQAVYERFVARLVEATARLQLGDPADPSTDMGPLINAEAKQRLDEAIDHARSAGKILHSLERQHLPAKGYFVGPTIIADLPRTDRLAREELFGPLVCVFRVPSFDEALKLANDTDYALTGGVYSRSPAHLEQAARAFDVGNVYFNRPITGAMVGRQPFGGHRLSGLGTKAGGPDYLLQFVVPKTVSINTARHGMPLE